MSHLPPLPLMSAWQYARARGLHTVTVWHDTSVPGGLAVTWTPNVDLYPGSISRLRRMVWMAVLDRNRLNDQPDLIADMAPWTLTCGTAAILAPGLPRYGENTAEDVA